MDGYTYRVPKYEIYPVYNHREDGSAYPEPSSETDYEVFSDFVVPNGMWVLERPTFGCTWIVGTTYQQVSSEPIDLRSLAYRRTLCISDTPFGFVKSEEATSVWGSSKRVPTGPCLLKYARQIHKGELGQGIQIPKLKFARESAAAARKNTEFERGRDQKRNPFRWARLSDVVEAAGLPANVLLQRYWAFNGSSIDWSQDYRTHRTGEFLHVRIGETAEEITAQPYRPTYLDKTEAGNQIRMESEVHTTWIRAGFANTLLRLVALNYQPDPLSIACTIRPDPDKAPALSGSCHIWMIERNLISLPRLRIRSK
ncbi:hypothetical protein HJC99_00345 [Candidatus Saccharibacteria bacterium]|nr:hypothetical protein [Candidatus Saccharibacteria bacterium]